MIPSTLAATGGNVVNIIFATAALLVILIIGFIAVAAIRRYYHDSDSAMTGPAFTLHDLRRMRRDGEIDDEQYERLRQHIIGALAPEQTTPDEQQTPPQSTDEQHDPNRPEDPDNDDHDGRSR